ncbi:MAG TPA: haloacid dehalogenase-like hydrolase [Candidatus Thermoplasmatota archaeon]|nr:haloacid dehalogenase-like hydrolase [Candidatus Thermoplasmatota archaeon]
MSKKLNVIDLDNTLLPYNSWGKCVMEFLQRPRCFMPIIYYSLLRGFGLLSRGMYQKSLLGVIRKTPDYEDIMRTFGESLYEDVCTPLLRFVQEETDEGTVVVLCTASPEDYVKYLSAKLGWQYVSSTLDQDLTHFNHMFREKKITAIQQRYPRKDYDYHLAMSDDRKDFGLLKLFEASYLVRKGRWKEIYPPEGEQERIWPDL